MKRQIKESRSVRDTDVHSKRKYEHMCMETIDITHEVGILASSIVDNSIIESVGQEKGESYNFQTDGFNYDWNVE